MTIKFEEAITIADIISDHVTEDRQLAGAMARLRRAWPEFKWEYRTSGDGRRIISINTTAHVERSRPSPVASESRTAPDRAAPSSSRGSSASQNLSGSHPACDRRRAPATTLVRGVAESVARRSTYDIRIINQVSFRTAKLSDIINAERAGAKYTRLMTLLRTRKAWPKDAELPEVYSEQELEDLIREAELCLPGLPLEALIDE